MDFPRGRAAAIITASAAAGPLFVVTSLLCEMYLSLPEPIDFSIEDGNMLPIFLVAACVVGFFLSLVPNLIGTLALSALGAHHIMWRKPIIWALVGAIPGLTWAIYTFVPQQYDSSIDALSLPAGIVLTSVLCALICRYFVRWEQDIG